MSCAKGTARDPSEKSHTTEGLYEIYVILRHTVAGILITH